MSLEPTRLIWFNIDQVESLAVYLMMALPLALLAYGLTLRVQRWRQGLPENRDDHWLSRILYALRFMLPYRRIARCPDLYTAITYGLIFFGFMTLLAGTLIVMVQNNISQPVLGVYFFKGHFYLYFKGAMNAAGLCLGLGVVMALYRRLVMQPGSVQTSMDDVLILIMLGLLVLQGFALQALRLALTRDAWALWSFVSYPLSLALQVLPRQTVSVLHHTVWWTHFATAMIFLGYIAYKKRSD
ncbi:MAG: hypothetical protein WCH96_09485 [Betaproteobacteria bacterium]